MPLGSIQKWLYAKASFKKNNPKGFYLFDFVFRINSSSFCVASVFILFIFGIVGDNSSYFVLEYTEGKVTFVLKMLRLSHTC